MRNKRTLARLCESGRDLADWYNQANQGLQAGLGNRAGLAADILAVTSPRVQLRRNVNITRHVLARWDSRDLTGLAPEGILPNVVESLHRYRATGKITGKKTGPFARALRGDSSALVLDVWMARALGIPQSTLFNKSVYPAIVDRMTRTAQRFQFTIAECQAAIWSGTLRDNGRNPQYFPVHLLYQD